MSKAIVLSGGGARGAFQVGVLKELLLEQAMVPEVISGVSIGAVNGFFAAQGPDQIKKLESFWREIETSSDVYRSRWFSVMLMYMGWQWGYPSIYKPGPFQKRLRRYVRKSKGNEFVSDFRCGAVDLISGNYKSIGKDHYLLDQFIFACMSVPVIFPAVKIKDKKDQLLNGVYIDGAVRNVTPLMEVIRHNPNVTEIHVVMTTGTEIDEHQDRFKRFRPLVGRAVDINQHEMLVRDIENVLIRNELAAFHKNTMPEPVTSRYRHIDLKVYHPLYGDLDHLLKFDQESISHSIEAGGLAAATPLGNNELQQWFNAQGEDETSAETRQGREFIPS